MEAAIQLLRSNYVYRQVFRSIGENFENIEKLVFLFLSSVGKREIVCWQERDLSVGKRDLSVGGREMCLLAKKR